MSATQPKAVRDPWMIAVHRWVQLSSGVPQDRIRWSDSTVPWPSTQDGPWISLRDLGDDGGREISTTRRRTWTFFTLQATGFDAASDQLQMAQHPFQDGDGPVRLVGDDLPAGLAELVDYWTIRDSAGLFRLASSFGNAIARESVDVGVGGALPIGVASTPTTRRAGAEAEVVTGHMLDLDLSVQCRGLDALGVLRRMRTAGHAEANCTVLHDANVGLLEIGGLQNVGAALNSATYEPRAAMTVRLSVYLGPHIDTVTVIETIETEGSQE